MLHTIEATRATLHGAFLRERPPILTIEPGEVVRLNTLDAGWGLEPPHEDWSPRRKVEPRDKEADAGHCLVGPIAVKGAQPGMVLEVHVDALRPGAYGWNSAGGWPSPVNTALGMQDGPEQLLKWTLDTDKMMGRNQFGQQVALRPHLGIIGLAPDAAGYQSTVPPRACGGNMDCKELGMGASVFLPVAVEGALLSVGDGHALMADGEVSSTGIECPMDLVQLTVTLHPEMKLNGPRILTPTHWITLGFDEDLDVAMIAALEGMLDLMVDQYDLPRRRALALASLVVDLRITQVVNGVRGVHAMLAHGAVR
jgi:acetamidase/formamidase